MELKDGKLIISDEEKTLLGSDEGKKWLTENKFITEVEKKVEVDKPLTDEIVKDYIAKNQGLSDKIYNENAMKFLKTKLGKEATIDDLGKEITFKDDLNKFKSEAIKTAVSVGLNAIAPKHSKLLINAIDFTKLDIKDNSLVGFDDELNNLKTTYPDLFKNIGSTTPQALPTNKNTGKITYEDFQKMTEAEKAKVSDEELKGMLKD